MNLSNFDAVSTEQARSIRDGAERIAIAAVRAEGEDSAKAAAAWVVFRMYDLLVKSREVTGCK